MKAQKIEAFTAKKDLIQILHQVKEGQTYDICMRMEVVARLVPASKHHQRRPLASLSAHKMLEFMQDQSQKATGADVDLTALINEDRA